MRAASVAWLLASCLAATLAAEDQAAAPVPVPGERVQLWLLGDVNKRATSKRSRARSSPCRPWRLLCGHEEPPPRR